MKDYIIINTTDNVAVALQNLTPLSEIDGLPKLKCEISAGHKVALCDIKKGETVIKYGEPIGRAKCDIERGEWVHSHNLETALAKKSYVYEKQLSGIEAPKKAYSFLGYRRKDGRVGIRNFLYIVATVGCVNGIVKALTEYAEKNLSGMDGVIPVVHQFGCSQLGCDHKNTQKLLRGVIENPNAGGVLVVGLGCENNNLDEFQKLLSNKDTERIKFLNSASVKDELAEGKILLGELTATMSADIRESSPVSALCLGLKCGGSDGFSGITANPLIGSICDKVTSLGGGVILTEVPEMFGAENLIFNRACDNKVFDACVRLVEDFKDYFIKNGEPISENPSPGNKAGGITTLEEKALGCTQKSGRAQINEVILYGEGKKAGGLSLLQAPGNDIVASSALAAAGAALVLFSTGRGTPLGGVVPVMKLSSNTPLFERKGNWMDFDAGRLLFENFDRVSEELFEELLEICSGRRTKAENNGFYDFAVFKNGITL